MKQQEQRTNHGYTIIANVALPNEEYVLGEMERSDGEKQYVTWCCVNETDYYYGHYISDKDVAMKDMYERAEREIRYRIEQLERKIIEKGGENK